MPVPPLPRKLLPSLAALLLSAMVAVNAQELVTQPTPFTVLLDFALMRKPDMPAQALPIWLESAQIVHDDPVDPKPPVNATTPPAPPLSTIYRLRLRPMPGLNDSVLLRLFFEDKPDAHPKVTGWSETGAQSFPTRQLGAGLGLPASESLAIPTKGVDYIEIEVAGDGSSVSKAFLATLKKNQVSTAFDFAPAEPVTDPFGAAAPSAISPNDLFLFGRVRATLDAGPVKLDHLDPKKVTDPTTTTDPSSVQFGFNLEGEPLLAMVTFEMLNVDPTAPVEAWVNGQPLGPVSVQLPDLADPAYAGIVRSFEKMRFHYTGWVRCQKAVPGWALRSGANAFTLQLPTDAPPGAVRVVELQLKHSWNIFSYTTSP